MCGNVIIYALDFPVNQIIFVDLYERGTAALLILHII